MIPGRYCASRCVVVHRGTSLRAKGYAGAAGNIVTIKPTLNLDWDWTTEDKEEIKEVNAQETTETVFLDHHRSGVRIFFRSVRALG